MVRIWTPTRFGNKHSLPFPATAYIIHCPLINLLGSLEFFLICSIFPSCGRKSSKEEKLLVSFKSGIINGIFNLSWLLCFLLLSSCRKISCFRLSLNNHIYICQVVTLKLSRLAGKKKSYPHLIDTWRLLWKNGFTPLNSWQIPTRQKTQKILTGSLVKVTRMESAWKVTYLGTYLQFFSRQGVWFRHCL